MYLRRNLTFELDGEVIRVVEREHLFVGGLVIGVEREMCGEDKYGKELPFTAQPSSCLHRSNLGAWASGSEARSVVKSRQTSNSDWL